MASNNFFLNNDPLLYQNPFTRNAIDSEETLNKQLRDYKLLQQQAQSQNVQVKDYVGDLDKLIKGLDKNIMEDLNSNHEFTRLSADLNSLIQTEIMNIIKWKLNSNASAIKNIERQTDLINEASRTIEEEKRKNLNELNDYVKNYSNITFDEYKKIKNKETEKTS